jgi:murein L,D-transpeptidase YafK
MRRVALFLLLTTGLLAGLALLFIPAARLYAGVGLQRLTAMSITLPYAAPPHEEAWRTLDATQRLADVNRRVKPVLIRELAAHGLRLGQKAFIRLFKESREFEFWMQSDSGEWKLFRTYLIAVYSGTLGPKLAEGDGQAPEGFYDVVRERLNPASRYHLAFNIGYPNAFDRHHARTGSLIMVHGNCVSIGCFAMTDPVIEEIYLIVAAALEGGQKSVPVHSFPFRMTDERLQRAASENSPWLAFWQNLRTAHDQFESTRQPPKVRVKDGRYECD